MLVLLVIAGIAGIPKSVKWRWCIAGVAVGVVDGVVVGTVWLLVVLFLLESVCEMAVMVAMVAMANDSSTNDNSSDGNDNRSLWRAFVKWQ